MSHARYLVGDVFDRLAEIPDGSVDLVLTSPPFLALRSYLPAGHPDKGREIGSESTPAAFLDTLLALTAEWRRVLAPHGSICVELGDTYSGSGGAGGDYAADGLRAGQPGFTGSASRSGWHRLGARADQADQPPNYRKGGTVSESGTAHGGNGWPRAKSLCGIPHLYHLSLAYGRNLLTGTPSPAGDWLVRNVVAWCRPNPPVGALGDKFRPGTSYLTIACTSPRRWFDLDAVRTPGASYDRSSGSGTNGGRKMNPAADEVASAWHGKKQDLPLVTNPAGAPPLDWWEIPTQPYPGAHYATWPQALCTRPILAMCPRRVCLTCGEPSRRIVGEAEYVNSNTGKPVTTFHFREGEQVDPMVRQWATTGAGDRAATRVAPTLGWTSCGHESWRNGLVLDPFGGSGTTGAVSTGHGRDCILIDLDERNAQLAQDRIGMFLEVIGAGEPMPELNASPRTQGGAHASG